MDTKQPVKPGQIFIFNVFLIGCICTLTACNDRTTSSDIQDNDMTVTAPDAGVTDSGNLSDTTTDTTTDITLTDANITPDSSDTGEQDMSQPPDSDPVNFLINHSGDTPFLLTEGENCLPFTMERKNEDGDYEPLDLKEGYQCGCECPSPPLLGPKVYKKLEANTDVSLSWDGIYLQKTLSVIDCGEDGTVQDYSVEQFAAEPGDYRITLAYEDSINTLCTVSNSDTPNTWYCALSDDAMETSRFLTLCPASQIMTAEFTILENSSGTSIAINLAGSSL